MLLEKTNRFWKAGLIQKNKKALFVAMIMLILPIMTGCSDETPEVSDIEITQQDSEVYSFANNDSASTERIEEILSDIYEEAVVTNTLGSLDIMRRMVARLGENGYVAVDSWNQIDMVQAEQAIDFCKAVDEKEMDILTLSDTPEHTMLRILPLDEKCREYNRKYILPVGYEQNNLFLCNWSEDDFGDLDFYDLFDRFYPMMPSQNGITTLYVDRVWIDYNSDYIFTNQIAVQPFPDGTFRYLSNTIEQKDLELPQRGK